MKKLKIGSRNIPVSAVIQSCIRIDEMLIDGVDILIKTD